MPRIFRISICSLLLAMCSGSLLGCQSGRGMRRGGMLASSATTASALSEAASNALQPLGTVEDEPDETPFPSAESSSTRLAGFRQSDSLVAVDFHSMIQSDVTTPSDREQLPAPEPEPDENPIGDDDSIPDVPSSTNRSLLDLLTRPDPDAADPDEALQLETVIGSVENFFPVIQSAFLERTRTAGDQIAAWGEFDTKVKGYSENQPLGFYENYQQGAGIVQPRYRGGEVFAGYRIGRGVFEPWYEERQTNEGGEFKVGFDLPLLRNHDIDKRRADLWRATYDRQLAEPEIRAQIIGAVLEATASYWIWVAAGQQYRIGLFALDLAERRNRQVARRVEEGDLGPPSLADNDRAIAVRKAKLLDLRRKLEQSAVKLSLFVRDANTIPLIPTDEALPPLPTIPAFDMDMVDPDIQVAINRRPEIDAIDIQYRRTQVDFAEASNDTLPDLNALANVSQDMGEPTSSTRDKSELELEVGFVFEMPIQLRKGLGKMQSARAKLRQLQIKRQFQIEKIATEVRAAAVALQAAYGRVQETMISVELAEELARVSRREFEAGQTDLLDVFLREQFAIEAADELILAKLDYLIARAEYNAALAFGFEVPVLDTISDQQP
ncbi:MAG: TolC family protein [Planctomycetota bacterium]